MPAVSGPQTELRVTSIDVDEETLQDLLNIGTWEERGQKQRLNGQLGMLSCRESQHGPSAVIF